MTTTHQGSYDVSTFNINMEREFQRLRTWAHLTWKKEAETLSRIGLQDGMSIIELGCGPGFTTEQLLSLLPNSEITAVDIDPIMVKQAKQYLSQQAVDNNRFKIIETSVMDTGLADNHFDFAIERFVFLHLPNPAAAVKEIFRILKPGGKFAMTEDDSDILSLFDPPLPEFKLIVEKLNQVLMARGGNPKIIRRLLQLLKEVGFHNVDVEAFLSHSENKTIEDFFIRLDPEVLAGAVNEGFLTEEQLEDYRRAIKRFLTSPTPFILLADMIVHGEKPHLPI